MPSASAMPPSTPGRRAWLIIAALMAITLLAYARTFTVPYLFDDDSSIPDNPSIRQLSTAFSPPPLVTVTGRPLLNASFALNYAISGTDPWSYHAVNLLIHLGCGWLIFGTVRRLLALPALADGAGARATEIATASAALWLLHPLQTESITYLVQRAEALMALCYLTTLYGFVRALGEASTGRRWLVVSFLGCLAGMAAKEVAVSAPLFVLLLDRALVTGSFRAAWAARRPYYLALAATWILLGALVLGSEGRGGTAGFDTEITPVRYALTQAGAIVLYLKLALWPSPLVFDYGTPVFTTWKEVMLPLVGVSALIAITLRALWRNRAAGLLGALFFGVLAPSSSIVPIATQTIAEHRVYLPLAAVSLGVAMLLYRALGSRAGIVLSVIALGLATTTACRNELYRDEEKLWRDTAAKAPANARAHYNVAVQAAAAGRHEEAVRSYTTTLTLDPTHPEAHNNLAASLDRLGRHAEALPLYLKAAKIDPGNPEIQNNTGYALVRTGQIAQALSHYAEAVRLRPAYPEAHTNFGEALAQVGRVDEAIGQFQAALQLRPGDLAAQNNLAGALLQAGHTHEAIVQLEALVRAQPALIDARSNLGLALIRAGRLDDAIPHYEALLKLTPDDTSALNNLAYIALQQGRASDAVNHYAHVAQLDSRAASAHLNLGIALSRTGRWREATSALEAAAQREPANAEIRRLLEQARMRAR